VQLQLSPFFISAQGGERKYKSRERTKELGVGCFLNNAATAKVQNPNPWNCRTGLDQKVLWLNISVEDTPRVEIDHGLNQLPQNDLQKETERKMKDSWEREGKW